MRINYLVFLILFFVSCGQSSTDEKKTEPDKKDTVTIREEVKDTIKTEPLLTDTILIPQLGENNLYGFQDTSGNWLIKPQFKLVGDFSNGLAPVLLNEIELFYIINTQGHAFHKVPYDFISIHNELAGETKLLGFRDGLIPVIDKNNKIGFMDRKNNLKIPFKYDEIGYFSEGVCPVAIHNDENLENDWGLIDKNNKWIVKPSMQDIWSCSDNRCLFKLNEKIGYFDVAGKIIIKPTYVSGYRFKGGLTFVTNVESYSDYNLIDTNGKIINKGPYDYIYNLGFENGECEVMKNGKCIIINKTGKKIRDKKDGCQEGC